jgi:hypothetical protein
MKRARNGNAGLIKSTGYEGQKPTNWAGSSTDRLFPQPASAIPLLSVAGAEVELLLELIGIRATRGWAVRGSQNLGEVLIASRNREAGGEPKDTKNTIAFSLVGKEPDIVSRHPSAAAEERRVPRLRAE